jgi:hypothetical protein
MKTIKVSYVHELEVPEDFNVQSFVRRHKPQSMWDNDYGVVWNDCRVFVEETHKTEVEYDV